MSGAEGTLVVLLAILTLGLIIPELLKKSNVPFITLLILIGAIFGPNGLNYIEFNETINFFGFLGMGFLMFMAGLETDISNISKSKSKIFTLAILNGAIPFLTGLAITKAFGYSLSTSVLVGVVFISSSVAVIVPYLEEKKKISKNSSSLMLSSIMATDVISLVALGFIFQRTSPITQLPLPHYFALLLISIPLLFYLIPKITKTVLQKKLFKEDGHEEKLRLVIVILVAVLAYFSLIGVHPILAAFLAGLSLSGIVKNEKSNLLHTKIHTLGYGIFVPVFFFIVGMEMNLFIFTQFDITNLAMIILILGLISSKFISGYIAGKAVKFNSKESLFFGSISMTQLTTTLAVTYTAATLGLLDSDLVTTVILLSVITTFLGPTLATYISNK